MGTRALSCALSMSVAATVASLGGVAAPASADPAVGVTLVAATETGWFGQIEWHGGAVYSVRDNDELVSFPADGSAPASPASTTPIPFAWHGDGSWQSDREAFVVATDGSVYLRSPGADGWGIGRLDGGGTVTPVTPPPGSNAFHGSSESLVIDPEGDSVYLGGARYRDDGYTYGVVGRLPLPAPVDQLTATQTVVSADAFVGSDPSTHHRTPFRPVDDVHAATQAFIDNPAAVDVRGGHLYFDNGRDAIERVHLATGAIQTVAGSPWVGDRIPPAEGMPATTPNILIQAGPVVDRAGNIFFSDGDPSRYTLSPGIIWEIRASDGTLHQVAGGGADDDADTGDDPLSLALHPIDLELDPDGNLYVSDTNDTYGQRRIVRLNGVAAADTAPAAPVGLTAEAGDRSLVVSWQAPADDGGQPVTSYTVRLHPSGVAGPGQDLVRQVIGLTSPFTGLVNDASYDVSVRATNGRGDGPDSTVTGSPADWQAALAAVTPGTAPYALTLDASGSRAPAGATYQFFCGDRDTPAGAPSTVATASCTYARGSSSAGWQARVVMRDPSSGRSFERTRAVVVADQPDTVEGSSAFPTDHLVVDVPVAGDGSLTSDSCGAGSVGATCRTVDGARIVLTAAPGTFSPTSHVRIYRGDAAALQSELGSDVQVQNGFAITWTPKVDLTQPLLVNISPATGGRQRRAAFDLGGFFSGLAQGMSSAATTVANTVGSAVNAAANAVGSSLASLWAAATQNLVRPNNSATNDVVMCKGEWRSTLSAGWRCSDSIMIFRGVPTERITSLDAGSGVVAAGGANVVAAGGANAVAAGGLNLLPAAEPGQAFQLNANSVVASGGLNVIAPGGGNIISDNGLGVVAAGGANVVASGGLNLTAIAVRDPGFAVVTPGDPTPPTVSATLDPATPSSGVYPAGTTVQVHLNAAAAGGKSVQKVHAETTGSQLIPHTVVAGSSATVEVSESGTTTVAYGATDDQLAESTPGTVVVQIAAPATVRSEQNVAFTQPVGRTYGAVDGPLQATSSSGLPVTLTSLSADVCTVIGTTVHVVAAGSCRVEGSQSGDAARLPAASVVRAFAVTPAPLLVTASNAVMVPKGKKPKVGATYAGFVAGDDVYDLAAAAGCSANPKTKVTSCSGVQARNYAPSYRSGKVALSRSGYAIISSPVVQGRRGARLTSKVLLDGGAATLTSKGGLPPGIKAVSNKARTTLAFVGVPTAAGTWQVKVTASVNGKVAKQTLTFVIA